MSGESDVFTGTDRNEDGETGIVINTKNPPIPQLSHDKFDEMIKKSIAVWQQKKIQNIWFQFPATKDVSAALFGASLLNGFALQESNNENVTLYRRLQYSPVDAESMIGGIQHQDARSDTVPSRSHSGSRTPSNIYAPSPDGRPYSLSWSTTSGSSQRTLSDGFEANIPCTSSSSWGDEFGTTPASDSGHSSVSGTLVPANVSPASSSSHSDSQIPSSLPLATVQNGLTVLASQYGSSSPSTPNRSRHSRRSSTPP